MTNSNVDGKQALNSDVSENEPIVSERFAVTDATTATWLVRRIVEARRYAEHVQAWATAEIRRAERDEQFFRQRYGAQLEAWARAEIDARGSRRRSVSLPSGIIGFRTSAAHLTVIDEPAMVTWCRANLRDAFVIEIQARGEDAIRLWAEHSSESSIKTTIHVDKSVLSRHVKTTGECPESVELTTSEKFFVK